MKEGKSYLLVQTDIISGKPFVIYLFALAHENKKKKTDKSFIYHKTSPHQGFLAQRYYGSVIHSKETISSLPIHRPLYLNSPRSNSQELKIWRKLDVRKQEDESEHYADRMSEQVLSAQPSKKSNVHPLKTERFIKTMGEGISIGHATRKFMESRFGFDFRSIRIHDNNKASESSNALNASAYAVGTDIFFGQNQYQPNTRTGQMLLAHELAHSIQQSEKGPSLQRRLIVTGSNADVRRFFNIVEPAIQQQLQRNPATNEVNGIASLPNPIGLERSPALEEVLTRIMNDRLRDAEIRIGTAQPGVAIGAFPQPADLTGSREQRIDIDDIENINAGAPGSGTAFLAHEIAENYEAHSFAPVAGVNRFDAAHTAGNAAQSNVAEELVGPGRRVAEVVYASPVGPNVLKAVVDFTNYYLVFDLTRNPATNNFSVSNTSQTPKVNVSINTVDSFVRDSDAVPPTGAAAIAAAVADVVANPSSTVLIEGFTDSSGTPAHNLNLGQRRAENVRANLVAMGVSNGRIHVIGRGQTGFVAPNVTDVDKARNRRVVITVTRPGP
jgi:outer membrane protein OmpA-like peptidoglycan-associated protein